MPIRLSVDDGCKSDLRVAELADKYGIEAIFYWPVEHRSLAYDKGYEPLKYIDQHYISQKFEIGSHTLTHRHLTDLPVREALDEIIDSRTLLQDMFHVTVTKFCPPRGYINEDLLPIIQDYYDTVRLTKGIDLVHIHPNSGANGNRPWRECITRDTEEIWCHSWELDKYNLWDELENFLKEQRASA